MRQREYEALQALTSASKSIEDLRQVILRILDDIWYNTPEDDS